MKNFRGQVDSFYAIDDLLPVRLWHSDLRRVRNSPFMWKPNKCLKIGVKLRHIATWGRYCCKPFFGPEPWLAVTMRYTRYSNCCSDCCWVPQSSGSHWIAFEMGENQTPVWQEDASQRSWVHISVLAKDFSWNICIKMFWYDQLVEEFVN